MSGRRLTSAQAMAGGSFKEPFAVGAWPTAEFDGMWLEDQVKPGFRNELAAMEDPAARLARHEQLVEAAYQRGKALNQLAVLMAEQIGTLAAMASGPFVVQTGRDGGSTQFRAMGASLGDRGRLVEEGIAAVQALLRGETVSSARWSIAEARIAP